MRKIKLLTCKTAKRLLVSLMVVFTFLSSISVSNVDVLAAPVGNVTVVNTGYTFSWESDIPINPQNGNISAWNFELSKIYADGVLTTCFDPTVVVLTGGGYESNPAIESTTRRRLARLAVANDINSMSNEAYAAFQIYQHQIMFGASHGFRVTGTNVNNLQGYINQFEAKATAYWTAPTFNLGDGKITVGETKKFNVTNGVTSGWGVTYASSGVTASFSNGVLTVTNNNTSDTKIELDISKLVGTYKRPNLNYNKVQSQQLGVFGISDPDKIDITLQNLRYGSLEIAKMDNHGNYIPNTSFDVFYNDNGSKIGSYTTGADGKVKVDQILPKEVKIVETSVPAPLILDATPSYKTIVPNETVSYTKTNVRAVGKATLTKVDNDTGGTTPLGDARLDNAQYALKAKVDVPDPVNPTTPIYFKNEIVKEEVLGTDLTMVVENLPVGEYYFEETVASTGYHLDTTKYDIDLRYVDSATAVIEKSAQSREQVILGKDALYKVSSDGSVGVIPFVEGAEFTWKLKSEVDLIGWDNAKTYFKDETNALGYLVTDYMPYGTYIRRETKTPENYISAPDRIVTIHEQIDNPQPEIVNDAPFKAKVKIVKQDADTGETVTSDYVTFKLIDTATGEYVKQKIGNKWIDEFTTTDDGTIAGVVTGEAYTPLSLFAGKYEVVEAKIPTGYLDAKTPIYVEVKDSAVYEIDDNFEPVITVIVKNKQPKAQIELTKSFEELDTTYDKVAGFELTSVEERISAIDGVTVLYDAGEVINNPNSPDGLWYTDPTTGKLVISDLFLSAGELTTYTLQEKVTSEGYELDETIYEFEFEQTDTYTDLYIETAKVENKLIRTDLEVVKIDKYTGEIITGVEGFEFTFDYTFNGEEFSVTEAVDPETGKATFKDIPYSAEGTITETATNDAYFLSDEIKQVKVDKDLPGIGEVYSFEYENKIKPTIGTLATGINGEKTLDPTIDNVLIDVSMVDGLDPSMFFTFVTKAWIYDEGGNHTLYKEVRYENVTFEEADADFISKIEAEKDSLPAGTKLFFTEDIYEAGKDNPEVDTPIVSHNDPEDEGQTVRFEETEFTINVAKKDIATTELIKASVKFEANFFTADGQKVKTEVFSGNAETGIATLKFSGTGTFDYIEIREIEAPAGYILSDEVVKVTKDKFNEEYVYTFDYFNQMMPAVVHPQTGDTTNVNGLFGAMGLSFIGLGIYIGMKRKRTHEVE
ncbi:MULTISPECIES: LPXTG cell wall anchor domain-containing protein [unclassified Breznakia]|uniref:LPXTG cell wall anchor domain-containing protein n=1 Tax=unclassified Breznakia TaxID=2623764 RepID=UPI0024744D8C|nr:MULTISPECIES: LPXTG cell wall anchor domain-containing protein [unclassified Breznakia]MDH6367385.1 LPXTG-motif cell wall-anchored protein [Breznakia sp. PH1-1]MDH6403917.1 LPXTG-motif cell wall-anchored protein [Breznakia sp. PF1-11]MDH6411626.1 LPXTG-motif cell wall-anchored protein [Breznakia sp. PFB1-11]MDH6414552.1 LPXTG-motif cell wall-anchored protein [Breznakia sp. PFB1-14]MDH6418658.1 LPXTG-motif cell wall-anchored protein [Breznakia sp. PFB1-12]